MPKLNQRGVIAHLLLLLLLGAGLVVGVYLLQKGPLNFLPKASLSKPTGPETSFTLVGPSGCTAGILCIIYGQHAPEEEFAVKLYARSDIETANLFTAKMTFPKDLVVVKEIQIESEGSFIKNWVENFYDNNTGDISLVGGVPSPGLQTQTGGESPLMATIVFRAKAIGKGTVAFTDSSAILSNLNNINILTIKRGYDINVEVKPSPTPIPSPTQPPPTLVSRVFVTSTTYNGNLGGLSGADAKCQARADTAKLGGKWQAWLSDSTTSASSRLVHDTGSYKTLDGKTVANGWDDLIDGTIQNGINITEFNETLIGSNLGVWTGTEKDGSIYAIAPGYDTVTCKDWSSAIGGTRNVGVIGKAGVVGSGWTSANLYYCSTNFSLYCFEQNPYSSSPTPAPTCIPRPACMDAIPPCSVAPPLDMDWCPPASPTPAPKPSKGDGNSDGKINLVDMSVIHTDWMKNIKSLNFREGIDMNSDGVINTFDYGLHRALLLQLGVIRSQ